jgi:ABC-2 type transport system permease protein
MTGAALSGAFRAEWTKARTVPSTGWLLLFVVVATVGLGLAVTATVRVDECGAAPCALDTVRLSLAGVRLAQVGAAILGVLVVTGEYTTGTITATLAAVPRRWVVLVSKLVVVVTLVGGAAVVGVAGAVLVARAVLPGRNFTATTGYPATSLLHDLTHRSAVGSVLYLLLIALLSAGIGLMVRDTGAAVAVVLMLLFVAPLVALFISDTAWQERIHRFAPMDAGLAIQSTRDLAALAIGPWQGMALLSGYALAAVVAGGVGLRLRDA